jgi:hypothetical protein
MTNRPLPAWRIGSFLLALLVSVVWVFAADDACGQYTKKGERKDIDCYTCSDTGLVPCENHGGAKKWCLENEFYCSQCVKELACCRGRGLTPCECVDGDWENLVENPGYELFQGSIDGQASLVEYMKADPIYISTEHFLLMSTMEGLKFTPGELDEMAAEFNDLKATFPWLFRTCMNLSPHSVAHLYAYRLEKVYEKYCEGFGMTVDEDRSVSYGSRQVEVFLVGNNKEKAAWQARHNGAALCSGSSGTYVLSQKGGASGGRHKKSFGPSLSGDKNFHDGVIHMSGRCLLERYFCAGGGKTPPGWHKIGFPHWLQWSMLEQCGYYLTNIEVKGLSEEWIVSGWDKRAVSLARRGGTGVTSFPLLSKKDFADLGYRDHVLSWSYVDYLLRQDRKKFRKYCDNLRGRMSPRDALMDAYEWSELTLENKWRSFLLLAEDEAASLTIKERFCQEFDRSRNHPDLETRASAAYYLKFCDNLAAAERVVQAFQEGSILVRTSALIALKTFEDMEAINWVIEKGLTHASASVRRNTAIAMGSFPGLIPSTLPFLLKLLEDPKAPVRAGAVRALGDLHPDDAYMPMAALATDRDPEVRVEVALALWNYQRDEALTQVINLLRDPVWAVRLAAIRTMHNIRDPRMIPPIIAQLATEGGRLREDILELLEKLTHQNFGLNIEKWKWWWNLYAEKFQFTAKPSKSQEHKIRYAMQYHDVETCSKKFIFFVDVSSSMNEIVKVRKQEGKTYGKGDLRKKKIDVAKTELVRLLRTFDKNIYFNIITFSEEVEMWRKNVASAKKETRRQAEKYIWAIKPPQKAATNVYDSLMTAFDMVDAGFAKRKYESVVDTMFFLSDGNPTAGAVTDVDMILQTVRERNRIHGIKIHTFALSGRSGDTYFLRKLAELTGGSFQVIQIR